MKRIALLFSSALFACCAADEPSASQASAPAASPSSAPSSASPSASASQGTLGRAAPAQNAGGTQTVLGDKGTRPAADLTRSVEYYDGDEKRTLWLSESLVVEVAPSEAGKRALLEEDKDAVDQREAQRGMRLWKVRAPQGVDRFARTLTRDSLRFSPVLHETASSSAAIYALPGGVVATFKPDWNRARIEQWLAQRGLRIAEDVAPDANMYLVATPPGLESIEIANRLHESGELVSSTPNFWRQVTTR